MVFGNQPCIVPEWAVITAKSRGLDLNRRPDEKMIAYASRIMNVSRDSLRFTLCNGAVRAHYNFPDLLQRSSYELALELKAYGVSETTIGIRVLPMDKHALYNIVLFSKHVNVNYLRQVLSTQEGAKAATTWSFMPCQTTIYLLNGTYDAAVADTKKGLAASLCNPDNFTVTDFALGRALSEAQFKKALQIAHEEQQLPRASRTYRIAISKFNLSDNKHSFFQNEILLALIRVLRSKNCYAHSLDVEYIFNQLHDLSTKSNGIQVRQVCSHVLPALLVFFTNIQFTPSQRTPWWFLRLLHTALLRHDIRFAAFMHSMHTVNSLNAKLLMMPFRPEYLSRWPRAERQSAQLTYRDLLEVPYFTLWQATTVNAVEHYTPWSPANHKLWPSSYRCAVYAFMLCNQNSSASFIPPELVEMIFRFCFKYDFRL